MWCDYKIDESSLSVNKLKNTKTASIMCLSISQSISLFQPVIICADLFNAAVPWRRKLSTETAASAKNVRYSLTLRTREIAHYNTVPAIVKFVVDYNVSSRYNAGHDRLSKSLSFIYCISVFIKTECAAEIQILRVSVPFGICLFSDYEKYDIGFVCLGWICIPDTSVNYPVMHTPQEPEKYLRRNFEGEYSVSGVPFLEGTSLLNDTNLIIYGHNMKNGTMFSDVTKYREKDFCVKHPYIEFETKDGLKCYDVFAVVCVKKTDNWYKFSYAENEEQYRDKITEIKKRSIYDTGIVPEYGQQLITLSTCYGNAKDDRIIVIGAEQKESSRIAS